MTVADEKKDLEQKRKILQPEYAIGSGIITQDEYNNLKNEFFFQSELSLGLLLPIILIVLGLKLMPRVGLEGLYWALLCIALVPLSAVLFWVGMERRNKFRLELSLLILGKFQKAQDAAKKAQDDAAKALDDAKKAEQKAKADVKKLETELSTAKSRMNPLVIELNIPKEAIKQSEPTKGQGGTPSAKGLGEGEVFP